MQDELYGGARRRTADASAAQENADASAAKEKADRAERFKKQIRETDAEFLDEYMEFGREKAARSRDKMLEIVRQKIDQYMRAEQGFGWIHADEIAKTVTMDNVVTWLQRRLQRREQEKKEKSEEAERNQAVAQAKAEKLKKQIRENDDKFLDKYMMQAGEETRNVERDSRHDKMLEIVRKNIGISLREDLGLLLADEVANTVTKEIVTDWVQNEIVALRSKKWDAKPKEEIIKEAFEGSRGSLAATLKRARLLTKKQDNHG